MTAQLTGCLSWLAEPRAFQGCGNGVKGRLQRASNQEQPGFMWFKQERRGRAHHS